MQLRYIYIVCMLYLLSIDGNGVQIEGRDKVSVILNLIFYPLNGYCWFLKKYKIFLRNKPRKCSMYFKFTHFHECLLNFAD